MKIIVYLEKLNDVCISDLFTQIPVYDSIGETYIIDNSGDSNATNMLLSKLYDIDLPRTTYKINDFRVSLSESIEDLYINDYVLIVNGNIKIDENSIKELYKVALRNEHHTYVVPRSNGDCIERYPGPIEYKKKDEIIKWLKRFLGEYTLLPYAEFPCALVNMGRVYKHPYPSKNGNYIEGFPKDKITLSASLLEFSLLMGDYGFSSVCANHAYAEMEEQTDELQYEKQQIYREFGDVIKNGKIKYFDYYRSPIEQFGHLIHEKRKNIKILFFLMSLSPVVNGGTVHMLGVLEGLLKLTNNAHNYHMTVVVQKESSEKHCLNERFTDCEIVGIDSLSGVYDLCFVPIHLINKEYQKICCDHCLKLIFWPLDMISLRSNYICDPKDIGRFEFIAKYADGLMFFSESVKNDFEAYFDYVYELKSVPKEVSNIPDTAITMKIKSDDYSLPFDDYYLVMGNKYLHKMIYPTILKMAKSGKKTIFVGTDETRMLGENMYLLKSGDLSDSYMALLYEKCKALIYPSVYEGFGLPPVQTLNLGKEVFAMDMPVNHELEKLTPEFEGHIHYMSSLDELIMLLDRYDNNEKNNFVTGAYKRDWIDVGRDCLNLIEKVINTDIDERKLYARRETLR